MGERAAWEIHTMFIVWGVALLHACFVSPRKGWIIQFALAGVSLVVLAIGDVILVRTDFVWIDLVIAAHGTVCMAIAWGVARHTPASTKLRKEAKCASGRKEHA
jgi:hypothetical protein